MMPGQSYNVSVTMTNTGNTAWTYEGRYKLGSQNPRDNVTWGFKRVLIPVGVSVAPGQTYTFNFTVTAPATRGEYEFQWRMIQEGVASFGSFTSSLRVYVVPENTPDAAFVSQTVPTNMTPGATYNVSVTMKNIGSTNWTAADKYRLGSQLPRDNTNWGMKRVLLPANVSVAPGQNHTFNFTVTAPSSPGTYNFQWRMLQEGVASFGAFTPNVAVTVGTPPALDAAFVSQSVPLSMSPSQTYGVSITMRNTGNTTWTAADKYRLGSQLPRDNVTWGFKRVLLPSTAAVAPGDSHTFTFTVTAPATPGTYQFQWRMIQEGVASFGAFSPAVSITVQ